MYKQIKSIVSDYGLTFPGGCVRCHRRISALSGNVEEVFFEQFEEK